MILFFCERHESCALFQNIIFLNIYNEGRKGSVGRILSRKKSATIARSLRTATYRREKWCWI